MNLVEENRIWMKKCLRLSNIRHKQQLRRQKNKIMEYINAVCDGLKRRRTKQADECVEYIERRIIPYVEKHKWLPDSYLDILDDFDSGRFEREE